MNKLSIIVSAVGVVFGVGLMEASTNDTGLVLGFIVAVVWSAVLFRAVNTLSK